MHGRTVDGEVAEGRTGGALDLGVGALEEVEDRVERLAVDFADIYCHRQNRNV